MTTSVTTSAWLVNGAGDRATRTRPLPPARGRFPCLIGSPVVLVSQHGPGDLAGGAFQAVDAAFCAERLHQQQAPAVLVVRVGLAFHGQLAAGVPDLGEDALAIGMQPQPDPAARRDLMPPNQLPSSPADAGLELKGQ
jgi:hypothetical protein